MAERVEWDDESLTWLCEAVGDLEADVRDLVEAVSGLRVADPASVARMAEAVQRAAASIRAAAADPRAAGAGALL